jgi:hypothetical protein
MFLIPITQQRKPVSFAATHRTTRMPPTILSASGVRYAIVPRAVADAARQATSLAEARAIVASAVQQDRLITGQRVRRTRDGGRPGRAGPLCAGRKTNRGIGVAVRLPVCGRLPPR